MYILVKANAEDAYLVNHNCGVRLIAEYVKMKSLLPSKSVIDLCHHCGYLVKLHTLDPTTNGITIFKNRTLYYLIQYQSVFISICSKKHSLENFNVDYQELRFQSKELKLQHHRLELALNSCTSPIIRHIAFQIHPQFPDFLLENNPYYRLIINRRTGENSISHVPIPYVGENQKLSIQILNQIKRNNGECTCQSEPSLIEFSVAGTEGMFIEKAKLARMEKQLTLDIFNNRKIISDTKF